MLNLNLLKQPSGIGITSTLTAYPFNIKKILTDFSKIKHRGPPVRIMPTHKLEMIMLLFIAKEPVKTIIFNVLGHFPNLSRQGSRYNLYNISYTV